MGVLRVVGLGVASLAVFGGLFIQYAKKQMTDFKIDYSQAPGKVVLITGANSGLGYQTALTLAKEGAHVILACRSGSKCEEAKENILKAIASSPKSQHPAAGKVDALALDLSSFSSIKEFVNNFHSKYSSLDILINNAGIMAIPERQLTTDGLELQIGTNHFGHFLLTALLYPSIAKNGRIINHSSGAHQMASPNFVWKDLQSEKAYTPWTAYGNSKIANLYFTYELNRRLGKYNNNPNHVISIAVHPGYTSTNLQNERFPFWEQVNAILAMKVEDGALAQIYAAIDPHANPSDKDYIGPAYSIFGPPVVQKTSQLAWDVEAQTKLWSESERITGQKFL